MCGSIVKLPAIVGVDGVGDAEATYNVLPHKRFDASRSDSGQGLGLSPLGEVVYSHNRIFDLALALWHGSNEIQSPLGKWPRADHGSQRFSRELWDVGKSLTLVAFLCEGLGVSMEGRPEVSLADCLMG
ncbi:hypothetical protein L3X38_000835 [Prunus dulcis]|uniref:Uncharacterized protein n=1 Tax=Prunus dulcis TaxID=3755 RepID=A0AAD4ZJS1_PRUDU|nr:hypothetical protein L3X38_000835 [Prunus dulcis]